MNALAIASEAFGGIGLFLLGMLLMTDGLRAAGGEALKRLLGEWTSTSLRGLIAGMSITALLQSSSAVTVATIGFVNAGLLTLGQAIWVIFGSNVGTTMTAWLVALIGFNFKIELFALPMVGLGAMLHLFSRGRRSKALGAAIAGFGLLFLGIGALKEAFDSLGGAIDLTSHLLPGYMGLMMMVLVGALLTMLTQSSSATIAIVLTAAGGGFMPLDAAAAGIIGANVGTTSTAVLSAFGATPNAKRVAAAHVLFNLLTGLVALLLLPLFLALLHTINSWLDPAGHGTSALALFHSAFNLLGVVLMIPIAAWLTTFLGRRFISIEEDISRPRYLDHTVATVPALGTRALGLELQRLGDITADVMASAVSVEYAGHDLARQRQGAEDLAKAIARFVTRLSREPLQKPMAEAVVEGLRVNQYYRDMLALAGDVSMQSATLHGSRDPQVDEALNHWLGAAVELIRLGRGEQATPLEQLREALAAAEAAYNPLKLQILKAGSRGSMSIQDMENALVLISLLRRALQQQVKAAEHLARVLMPEQSESGQTETPKPSQDDGEDRPEG